MKKYILIALLLVTHSINANELDWVNKQIEAIKPPRDGLKSSAINANTDPFIFLKKNKPEKKSKNGKVVSKAAKSNTKSTNTNKIVVKKKTILSLTAVMNKSALINGKWYKLGEKVSGYKLSKVNTTSVLLIKTGKKLVLSTRSINKNLNFKNK